MRARNNRGQRIRILLGLVASLLPLTASAHGIAVDIAFYGGFTRGATTCLRRLGLEGRSCTLDVYRLHRTCMDAQLRGAGCDEAAMETAIDTRIGTAQTIAEVTCSGGQLTELGLISPSEARKDMRLACMQGETLAKLVYAPALAVPPVDEVHARCVLRAAALSEKLYRRTLDFKSQVIDRMAVRLLTPSQKRKQLNSTGQHVALTGSKVTAQLNVDCPQFEALYQKTAAAFSNAVERTGDCSLSYLYVQNAVICPL